MPRFYCSECAEVVEDDICRSCGEETEELCDRCDQILDNCNCEPAFTVGQETK